MSLAVAAALCGALAAAPAQAVVGGAPASRADYPFFAVVGSGCGGALVAPDRVLTAAHCREVVDERPRVRVGPDGARRSIHRFALHPTYVRWQRGAEREFPPGPADLILLELERPVSDIAPVPIANPDANLTAPGMTVETIGRGASAPDGGGQGVFRAGTVALRDVTDCPEQLFDSATRRWSLCAIDPRALDPAERPPFVSACIGDSGGPLLARTDAGLATVGTVSWGPACGTERDPEIFANAVRGRSFALDPRPIWTPRADGRPRIEGRARIGETVRCRADWIVRPRQPRFSFVVGGQEARRGVRATYRVRPADRGEELTCAVGGGSAGGRYGSPLSRPVRVTG